jgi:phosphoribosylaminoimidazolecarboxamide formyltransferase/IMP cyclohydrolase
MPTALLAAYEKTPELVKFADALVARGWDILASAGTARFLRDGGIAARDVAEIVGPPILGHRVVTLAREVYAGILSRKGNDEDRAELARINVTEIDLVFVTLYPLEAELAKKDATPQSIREKIDIGGPTLLRAAAKGERLVLTDEDQFEKVLEYLDATPKQQAVSPLQFQLSLFAERLVARYATAAAESYSRLFVKAFSNKPPAGEE